MFFPSTKRTKKHENEIAVQEHKTLNRKERKGIEFFFAFFAFFAVRLIRVRRVA